MSDLTRTSTAQTTRQSQTPAASGLLQRQCACGQHTVAGGECAECAKKSGLQRKLAIGASNDPLELEADRVADQVLTAPAPSAVSGAPLHIQRYTGEGNGQTGTAPASVDHILASSGRPLAKALQQDMEQRFGHDFSCVRVHSGGAAEQSARDMNANAYTVGPNMVFGEGRFAPETYEGRRLIAHELTHVVQQTGAEGVRGGQSNRNGGLSPISVLSSRGSEAVIQRDEVIESEEERRRKAKLGDLSFSPEVAASWGMPKSLSGAPKASAASPREKSNSHTSPAGLGPKPGPRTREEVIAATNVDPHRRKSASETPAPGDEEVMRMTGIERLFRAKDFAKEDRTLSADVKAEIEALFTWQALTGMALFAAFYIAAQVTPAGWIADALALTVLTISALFVGDVLYEIFKNLAVFVSAISARTWIQLRESGHALTRAIAKATVALVVALLTRTVKGAAGGAKPYGGPPGPGFAEAVTPEGFALRARVSAPAAAIPTPKSAAVSLASKAVGAPPPVGLSGKQPKGAEEPRSDDAAKGDKPSGKPDLIDAKRTENLKLKESLEKQVKDARDQHSTIIEEIQANTRRINELRKVERRPANAGEQIRELEAENRDLALDQEKALTKLEQLDRKIGQSQLTVYEKLSATSKGKVAKESARARKIDLPSDQPRTSEQIAGDHLYSLRELAAHRDFAKLTFDQQNALAHHSRNVVPMDSVANSSKGQLSWAEWGGWEKYYGLAARNKMLKIEVDVRKATHDEIARLLAEGPSGVAQP